MKVPAVYIDLSNRIQASFDVDMNFNGEGQASYPREVTIKTVLLFDRFENGTAYYRKPEEEK